MNKFKFVLIAFAIMLSGRIFGQEMAPPPPIDVPLLNSMTGSWVSEPYQMMGTSMTEETGVKMALNSQFMEINIRAVGTNGFIYEALVVLAPSADGTVTGWAFDVFGKDAVETYTGTWKDNMVYLYGTANWGTESRVINVNGNVMIHNVIMKMKDDKGKALPEMSFTETYNKK